MTDNSNVIELANGAKIEQSDDSSVVWFVAPDDDRWPMTDEEITKVVEREINIREEHMVLTR